MKESSEWLYEVCWLNPFTHAIELIRFALYNQMNWESFAYTLIATIIFLALAVYGYDPSRGIITRKKVSTG